MTFSLRLTFLPLGGDPRKLLFELGQVLVGVGSELLFAAIATDPNSLAVDVNLLGSAHGAEHLAGDGAKVLLHRRLSLFGSEADQILGHFFHVGQFGIVFLVAMVVISMIVVVMVAIAMVVISVIVMVMIAIAVIVISMIVVVMIAIVVVMIAIAVIVIVMITVVVIVPFVIAVFVISVVVGLFSRSGGRWR